jgi:DivIVA domain-containing protein
MPDQSYAATEHALLEEITGPLQRLAEEPLELAPADFPTAMRGYDREAVDEYVRYATRLVAELQAVRSPESAVRRALMRAGGQISGVLRRAHETAGEITAKSRSEAEDRLERARVEAEELLDTAERRVRDLDADTDRIWLDRQRIMADVEDLSNQLLGLAKQAGERFPDDDSEGLPADDESSAVAPTAYDQQVDAGADAPQPLLTDHDETLTLGTPEELDPAEPPEVEPRSARLSPEQRPDDERDDGDPDSAGMIPPISEAANRPRRS